MSQSNGGRNPFQLLDALRPEEYSSLKADIQKRGVLIPVEFDEEGNILDGHNRWAIARELGIDCPTIVRRFGTIQEKREHVIKINMARRHLDPIRWGKAFQMLCEERGVKTGQGARNDRKKKPRDREGVSSAPDDKESPSVVESSEEIDATQGNRSVSTSGNLPEVETDEVADATTVDDVAKELGVDPTTARRRSRQAEAYDALPTDLKVKVDSKELTLAQAKREVKRRKERAEQKARAKATPKPDEQESWEVRVGDCIEVMRSLEPGNARLIFADPPYNIGIDYGGGKAADLLPAERFLGWCREWILQAARLLTQDGSMWVLINNEWADHIGIILRESGLHRRAWLIWYETFGVNNSDNFNRTSRHLFYCVRDPKRFVFHRDAVVRPSDRQLKYNDRRADPGGKIWDDVWGISPPIPRLVENSRERLIDFPTQLPLSLLLPIVGCASDPGDLVLDPFSGSGTTGAAAIRLGRRYVGVEKNPHYAGLSRLRLRGERRGEAEV